MGKIGSPGGGGTIGDGGPSMIFVPSTVSLGGTIGDGGPAGTFGDGGPAGPLGTGTRHKLTPINTA